MLQPVSLVIFGAVVGYSTAPFLATGDTVSAALISGVFSTINVLLVAYITREVRHTRRASREAAAELKDVKRKVAGERRSRPDSPRPGGRRETDREAGE